MRLYSELAGWFHWAIALPESDAGFDVCAHELSVGVAGEGSTAIVARRPS